MLPRLFLFLATITSLLAQTSETSGKSDSIGQSRASVGGGHMASDVFIARSIRGNQLGDDIERKVLVYLPPSYDRAPRTRYPVIYLLHGWGDRIDSWINGRFPRLNIKDDMDRLIEAREISEMIVVMPDARNHYGGSYVNSSVTGAWADAIVQDLVGHIDRKYRTLASPDSRGLAGWAKGGAGALYLAMKYPGVYGSVYGLSSGRMDFDHSSPITDEVWRRVLELQRNYPTSYEFRIPEEVPLIRAISFATAFSPNPARLPFMADLPVQLIDGELKRVPSVWQRWLEHDPVFLVKTYAASLIGLRALQFDCDTSDPSLEANRMFAKELRAAHVPHTFEEYDPHEGDDPHYGHVGERIVKQMLPFFSNHLTR
jgi:enterochelin esterase-like enzyme